ncbi:hypothetical protein OS493_040663, partial [Desmophyllum pertusum]
IERTTAKETLKESAEQEKLDQIQRIPHARLEQNSNSVVAVALDDRFSRGDVVLYECGEGIQHLHSLFVTKVSFSTDNRQHIHEREEYYRTSGRRKKKDQ